MCFSTPTLRLSVASCDTERAAAELTEVHRLRVDDPLFHFDLEPITPQGISTASCDKLSQRNLAIDNSENPGSPETHRVQHTFAIHPTTSSLCQSRVPTN